MMNAKQNTHKVRRWYDTDPVLLEVLNFMELAPKEATAYASSLIAGVEKHAPQEALAQVYQEFEDPNRPKNRWYDENPILSKAIALLKMMPPDVQRMAALQFIEATKADTITYAILKESFATSELDLSYLDEDYDDATLYVPYAESEGDAPIKETPQTTVEGSSLNKKAQKSKNSDTVVE